MLVFDFYGLLQCRKSLSADLAIVNNTDNTVTVLLNNGDGTFVAGPNSPLATSPNPTGIAIADFAQNGTAGIAVTCAGSNTFRVFFAITAGLFTVGFEPPAGPSGSRRPPLTLEKRHPLPGMRCRR